MRKIIIILALLTMVGCMARTEVMLYGPDGKPVASLFDNKSRAGFELSLEPQETGPPKIVYKCEIIDANSVALKALSVADTTIGSVIGVAIPLQ